MQADRQVWRSIQAAVGLPDSKQDGRPGPITAGAIARFLDLEEEPAGMRWPLDSNATLERYYGEPGSGQVPLELPYRMVLAWDKGKEISRIWCHAKVRDSLEGIFLDALGELGMEKIKDLGLDLFGGCLNVRKKRGGSTWSVHAFGAAVDLDPDRNRLRWGKDRARLGQPDAEPWWDIVERHGGVSLGRERNFDWMHFQFARL